MLTGVSLAPDSTEAKGWLQKAPKTWTHFHMRVRVADPGLHIEFGQQYHVILRSHNTSGVFANLHRRYELGLPAEAMQCACRTLSGLMS